MKINIPKDENGLLPDKYGKFAPDNQEVSFPIEVKGIPAGAQYLAIAFIDYDAVPVGGFPFIHWVAANLPLGNIPEDIDNSNLNYAHGANSMYSRNKDVTDPVTLKYIGPKPPDKTHNYELTVFAIDSKLDLSDGFFYNDFRYAIDGHILDAVTVLLPSRAN